MKRLILYVHGKGGSAGEAQHYRPLFPGSDVVGFDYRAQTPWEAKDEFARFFDLHSAGYHSVILIANSIGAYFSMHALAEKNVSQALFISPIVDMERLITDMMRWAQVTEAELERRQEIPTAFGETLSWPYLCYVREHPVTHWDVPTRILYAGRDELVERETTEKFVRRFDAELTVMEEGEHWFHTEEQLAVLRQWIRKGLA